MPDTAPVQPPAPIFRISLGNATLLSAAYLSFAALIEVLRRMFTLRWAETMSEHLEEFPARTLRWFGLFAPLRHAYLDGVVGDLTVRLALGATVVVLIYSLAMGVGVLMWTARFVFQRFQKPAKS